MVLTDNQKNLLINREMLDPAKRRYNEFGIRKFFRDTLNSLEDLLLIFENLPERQIVRIIKDKDIFRLQEIEIKALHYKDFMPVRKYSTDDPESYVSKSLGYVNDSREIEIISRSRKSTEQDDERFKKMQIHHKELEKFLFERGGSISTKEAKHYYRDLVKDIRKKKVKRLKKTG